MIILKNKKTVVHIIKVFKQYAVVIHPIKSIDLQNQQRVKLKILKMYPIKAKFR
jgi:hypothetical protein